MTPLGAEFPKHILAADIGGTHSRFGHFTLSASGELALGASVWAATNAADSFLELLESLPGAGFDLAPQTADAAVFAVPGAVVGRRISFANIEWDLDLDGLERAYGLSRVTCLNDFLAQAHGCALLADEAEVVLPGAMDASRVQAVIGAGTGFGHAALVPMHDGSRLALASEAGHASMPFFGDAEQAFAAFTCRQTGEHYVRGDSVLSGSGLSTLHEFLTGERLTPAEVGARLTPESRTTELFARFYGRAARDYALTVVAAGGIYISGGVAAKNPLLVTHPAFAREFYDSPPFGGLLHAIGVRLVRNANTGLFGAASVGKSLLAQAG